MASSAWLKARGWGIRVEIEGEGGGGEGSVSLWREDRMRVWERASEVKQMVKAEIVVFVVVSSSLSFDIETIGLLMVIWVKREKRNVQSNHDTTSNEQESERDGVGVLLRLIINIMIDTLHGLRANWAPNTFSFNFSSRRIVCWEWPAYCFHFLDNQSIVRSFIRFLWASEME